MFGNHESLLTGLKAVVMKTLNAWVVAAAACLGWGSAGVAAEVKVFDTGGTMPEEPTSEELGARSGWRELVKGRSAERLGGDAVMMNRKAAVVFRKGARAAEFYGRGTGAWALRARLVPSGNVERKITGVSVRVNEKQTGEIHAVFGKGANGVSLAVQVGAGEATLKTRSVAGTEGLRVEAPGRFLVQPDFFAEDAVLDARTIPVSPATVPADNLLMQLVDEGNAIVTTIRDKNADDVVLTLTGEADARVVTSVEVPYGKGSIWVSVLEGAGIWHEASFAPAGRNPVRSLDWEIPFSAGWKAVFPTAVGTTEGWEFQYHPKSRRRWSDEMCKWYAYPCWIDWEEKGGTKKEVGRFQVPPRLLHGAEFTGALLVYPIERTERTPLNRRVIVDVLRNTLGVGPCQYIMDVQGAESEEAKGMFTCGTYDVSAHIYQSGRQKDEWAFLNKILDEEAKFIHAVVTGIQTYVKFGNDLRALLAEQRKNHPAPEPVYRLLDDLLKKIPGRFSDRRPERVLERVRAQIMADIRTADPEAILNGVGDNPGQKNDTLLSRCRGAVRLIRQVVTAAAVKDPELAGFAGEVRQRTEDMLKKRYGMH
jgi:hypothetical protein